MADEKLQLVRKYVQSKPYLIWGSTNYTDLSPQSIVENVLNYGNWDDFLYIKETLGTQETNKLFEEITYKKRVNLRPQTVNYFTKYFKKYA